MQVAQRPEVGFLQNTGFEQRMSERVSCQNPAHMMRVNDQHAYPFRC